MSLSRRAAAQNLIHTLALLSSTNNNRVNGKIVNYVTENSALVPTEEFFYQPHTLYLMETTSTPGKYQVVTSHGVKEKVTI